VDGVDGRAAAICIRCGRGKDLPLARCAGCGLCPAGDDAVLSILASRRILDRKGLVAAAARIRAGERLAPSARMLDSARAILAGAATEVPRVREARLGRRALALLVLGNVALTPMLGIAAWWRFRGRPGPAARQVLWATLPVIVAGTATWLVLATRPG
jgi:hypothetical protein